MLSFKLNDILVKKLKNIDNLASEKAQFLRALPQEKVEAIQRYARISTIGSTTRIENAILTDSEIDWMDETLSSDGKPTAFVKDKTFIENKLSKERERSIEEVAGCRAMLSIIYNQATDLFPLSESTIKGLHRELVQYYPPAHFHQGNYKKVPNNVIERIQGISTTKDVLKTADPGPITETAMRNLVDWYNQSLRECPWPVAVASELVFRFLAIHPFHDGNGRVGRALFLLALLQSGEKNFQTIIPCVALDRHIEKHKEEYYLVLRKCSEGKFSPDPSSYKIEYFLVFMLKMFEEAILNDIDFYAHKFDSHSNLADAPKRVLECFKEHPEKKLALRDILKFTEIPRRTAIYALNILVKENFINKSGRGAAAKYQLTF